MQLEIFFAASEIADDSVGILRTSEYSVVDSEHCDDSASTNTLCYGTPGFDQEEDCKVQCAQITIKTREVFNQTDIPASGCPGCRQSRGVQLRRRGAARADGHADGFQDKFPEKFDNKVVRYTITRNLRSLVIRSYKLVPGKT